MGIVLSDYVSPISKVTARDLLTGYLEGISEPPTPDSASRIVEELKVRGAFVRLEYLLDVWAEVLEAEEQ